MVPLILDDPTDDTRSTRCSRCGGPGAAPHNRDEDIEVCAACDKAVEAEIAAEREADDGDD